jgi:site-specific recombinase XerD
MNKLHRATQALVATLDFLAETNLSDEAQERLAGSLREFFEDVMRESLLTEQDLIERIEKEWDMEAKESQGQ